MTPTALARAGEALYGPEWQSELGRAVDISPRHIRRFLKGTTPIKPSIATEIYDLLRARRIEIAAILDGVS